MDIQISYENAKQVYDSVSTYEELIAEILHRFPLIQDIELQYQDEEGDIIQVSNTSDLIAISEPDKVVLTMTAKVNEQKVKEIERLQKLKEQQQKKKQEDLKRKREAIEKEEQLIGELEQEFQRIQEQLQNEIAELQREINQRKNYVPDQLVDFSEVIKESNLFDQVRDKESKLLLLEDKKGFKTQLTTITTEITQIFRQIYQSRADQLEQNYVKWSENKVLQGRVEQQLKKKEQDSQAQLRKNAERIELQKEKLAKLNLELQKLEQGQHVVEEINQF